MDTKTARTPSTPSVLEDPMLNRGVGFTAAEREALGLTGRLPAAVLTLEQQVLRAAQVWLVGQDAMWQPAYPDPVS
jgi:malate dehydrogenase (oxaloacetate-decarboxylating)